MKRKIVVSTPEVTITAVINVTELTLGEVERVRDNLADSLMMAASGLTYRPTPLSRVKVK